MLVSALFMAAFAAQDPAVLWLNACEIDPAGISVPAKGEYAVWGWAPDDAEAIVTLAGKELRGKTEGKARHEYAWISLGKAKLDEGNVTVALGERVAAIALSAVPGFDPKAAMAHTAVFTHPDRAADRRADTARHTDTVFTMPHYNTLDEWEPLADRIRKRLLISSGLMPLPERTPLNAEISGRIEHDDYSVEKVRFEARPGFYVTGNLYRPVGDGPFPAAVCPHGHWEKGRIEDGPRGSVPARCITMARMGIIAFSYDMIGYNDSLQFPHGWGGRKEALWGIHPFAMQLWSSVRAVDFVQGLPGVDPERIACVGASGGGTQTFTLTAIDPRIQVAAPVNMISHSMQGGCGCENAPIIRFENSNMEIGALAAPRPLLMVSATGDWTRETWRVEFPSIQSIYELHNAAGHVETTQVDAEHNFNQLSREAVYRFFGKWLLNDPERWAQFTEPAYTVEKTEDLRVFPDDKLPDGTPTKEEVIASAIAANRAKWQAILPATAEQAPAFRAQYGDALPLALGAVIPDVNSLDPERTGYIENKDYIIEHWVIRRPCVGDAIPAILYRSRGAESQDAVIVVHGRGKAALADVAAGKPGPLVQALIDKGKAVLAIDAFLLGEHSSPFQRAERVRIGNFMDTFQPTDTACRVQDVLTSAAFLRQRRDMTGRIAVIGLEDGGLWSLLAAAIDENLGPMVADAAGFDPEDDEAWVNRFYIPCIRAIGDIDTAAALIAPRPLVLFNAPETFTDGFRAAYGDVGADGLAAHADGLEVEAILAALS